MPDSPDLLSRFQALGRFLSDHQGLWRPKPFTERQLPWEDAHPQLAQWLRSRTLDEAEAAHNHPEHLNAPAPFPHLAAQAVALAHTDELPSQPLPAVEPHLSVDVPGRKWQQIEAFAAHLNFNPTPAHWLDWCAGKGHLGRRLTGPEQRLTCLEYDPALIDAGRALSARHHVNAEHLQQDVMAGDTLDHLHVEHTPVALHACGDLHVQLMHLASTAGCPQLAIAPCCYNRTASEYYQALSLAGQSSQLVLSRDDLGLPLSETVTAPARVRRQRDLSMARRLGFDLLQRQLRGVDNYLPTPSLPVAWLGKPYAEYCHELAVLKGLPAPGDQNWATLEAAGWQRLAEVRNLELVRNLFRRPLEMWLVLDRALFLQEQGYQVQLGTFCAATLTPRNLLLIARQKTPTTCG